MRILIIGSGGREHALSWKVAQSTTVSMVYVAPGNAGTALEDKVQNIAISATDIDKLIQFAENEDIGLTIVGPEVPLSLGIVDAFNQHNLKCLGPIKKAAQLESSKAYSKDFMDKYNISTAKYACFNDPNKAKAYLAQQPLPIVIKASGLAAGKGVIIAHNLTDANEAIVDMLSGNRFGDAGAEVVIEEFLEGEEASFIVLSDGHTALPMASSQDHKARDDGDKGPNTGGMGAYSPAPIVTQAIHDKTMKDVIYPVLEGMKQEGCLYKGFLYAGLMISPNGDIKVLEFNCRFGDPETQPIMMRFESDLVELSLAAINGELNKHSTKWKPETALGVVLAAKGYPGNYIKGDEIGGLENENNSTTKIFHAGTSSKDGKVLSDGGRVLCATALGSNIKEAFDQAYQLVDKVEWENKFYRTDIGMKAM